MAQKETQKQKLAELEKIEKEKQLENENAQILLAKVQQENQQCVDKQSKQPPQIQVIKNEHLNQKTPEVLLKEVEEVKLELDNQKIQELPCKNTFKIDSDKTTITDLLDNVRHIKLESENIKKKEQDFIEQMHHENNLECVSENNNDSSFIEIEDLLKQAHTQNELKETFEINKPSCENTKESSFAQKPEHFQDLLCEIETEKQKQIHKNLRVNEIQCTIIEKVSIIDENIQSNENACTDIENNNIKTSRDNFDKIPCKFEKEKLQTLQNHLPVVLVESGDQPQGSLSPHPPTVDDIHQLLVSSQQEKAKFEFEKENENKIEQDLSLHVQVNEEDCKVEDANIETLLKEAEAKKEHQCATYITQESNFQENDEEFCSISTLLEKVEQEQNQKIRNIQLLETVCQLSGVDGNILHPPISHQKNFSEQNRDTKLETSFYFELENEKELIKREKEFARKQLEEKILLEKQKEQQKHNSDIEKATKEKQRMQECINTQLSEVGELLKGERENKNRKAIILENQEQQKRNSDIEKATKEKQRTQEFINAQLSEVGDLLKEEQIKQNKNEKLQIEYEKENKAKLEKSSLVCQNDTPTVINDITLHNENNNVSTTIADGVLNTKNLQTNIFENQTNKLTSIPTNNEYEKRKILTNKALQKDIVNSESYYNLLAEVHNIQIENKKCIEKIEMEKHKEKVAKENEEALRKKNQLHEESVVLTSVVELMENENKEKNEHNYAIEQENELYYVRKQIQERKQKEVTEWLEQKQKEEQEQTHNEHVKKSKIELEKYQADIEAKQREINHALSIIDNARIDFTSTKEIDHTQNKIHAEVSVISDQLLASNHECELKSNSVYKKSKINIKSDSFTHDCGIEMETIEDLQCKLMREKQRLETYRQELKNKEIQRLKIQLDITKREADAVEKQLRDCTHTTELNGVDSHNIVSTRSNQKTLQKKNKLEKYKKVCAMFE